MMPRLWLFLLVLLAFGCGDTPLVVHLGKPGSYQVWIYVGDALVNEKGQRCWGEDCFFSLAPVVSSGQMINVLVEEISKDQAGLVVRTRWSSKPRSSFYTYLEFAEADFAESPAAPMEALSSVWGVGDDRWAVGTNLTILHLNRTRWTTAQWTLEPTEYKVTDCQPKLESVGGINASGVWAVGDKNTRLYRDTTGTWRINSNMCGSPAEWSALGSKDGQIFVAGFDENQNEVVQQLSQSAISVTVKSKPMPPEAPRSMVNLGETLAVLDGKGGLWEVDPGSRTLTSKPAPDGLMFALWVSKTSLFAGGKSKDGHPAVRKRQSDATWDSPSNVASSDQTVNGLWGRDDSNLWAVGQLGFLAHFNGSTWTQFNVPGENPPNFNAIWGDANSFWVVGDGGTIGHFYPN